MSQPKRVLVCGGRNFGRVERWERIRSTPANPSLQERLLQERFIYLKLNSIAEELHTPSEGEDEYGNWLPDWTIISGMAKGADTVAADWAVVNWCKLEEYHAEWDKYGKRAGYIRNKRMLDEGKPDLVIAFPGGRGTADMVRQAQAAGIEVREIKYEPNQA